MKSIFKSVTNIFSTPPKAISQKEFNSNELKIISWNVWFDSFESTKRYTEIMKICQSINPDIICFQEVTIHFLSFIRQFNLHQEYDLSDDFNGNTVNPYGTLTLCRKILQPKFIFIDFPSRMGRELLLTELHWNDNLKMFI